MDLLVKKYEMLKSGEKAVILFTTGSMNPVHVGHVQQLELAAEYFERRGVTVLAALLSPSDWRWSRHKPYGYLKNEDKLSLCRLVETELVKVDDWEISQTSLMDFPDVRRHLMEMVRQKVVKTRNIQVLYVCGADHAAKCNLFDTDWCVIVGRPGVSRPTHTCRATLLDNPETDESSTEIRKAIQEGRIETVRHMLHPLVYDKLSTSGTKMFQI